MQLVRLIYVSLMTEECDTEALQDILKVSRENNIVNDITGVLCYDPAFFLQCLEGPRATVNDLYMAIAKDPRHKNVTLLEYSDITERDFGEWSMGFLLGSAIDKEIRHKYSKNGGRFDPFILNAQEVLQFLLEEVKAKREHPTHHPGM